MFKEQAGHSVELPPRTNRRYLEHQSCEIIREVYQNLYGSDLDKFTYAFLKSLWDTLSDVVHHLERLPEVVFKEMIEVLDGLSEARSELRLAIFLFDVEEINPVHRLIMRNRAALRATKILQRVPQVWPGASS